MAYTNGIFYIDPVSGSDTARTALTSCTASNPSGSVTRINKTGHGLVTGAIVDLTLFSSWLNSAWKITVVDADNFDLDTAVWQATGDASGTVTPRGGSSWSDAWQTITTGASAARTAAGDVIRVAKTAVTSASVDATFTDSSATITLASALTKTIEHAESGWTASTNITGTTNTNRKYGATATIMTPGAPFTTGKVCYKAVYGGGTQDFSGYTKISLWFRPTTASAISASTYKLCLCSDATGDTIVNEINIPATQASSNWHIIVLDYGAALSSSVQSVAIYANSDPGTTAFSFNNIVACNSVTHETLIGWQDDCYYNPQSFDGTSVVIDGSISAGSGRPWTGTTGTAALYYAKPYSYYTTGALNTMQRSGTLAGGYVNYSGGWDTGSNTRNGMTYFASNIPATGVGFSMANVMNLHEFTVYARFASFQMLSLRLSIADCVFAACTSFAFVSNSMLSMERCKFLNSLQYSSFGGISIVDCDFFGGSSYGIAITSGSEIANCRFKNNTSGSVLVSGKPGLFFEYASFKNCLFQDASEFLFSSVAVGPLFSLNHDQTLGNHWGFDSGATINWQTTTKQGSDPGAWRTVISSSTRHATFPVNFKIGEFAVSADTAVTFTAWVKKDHATNVACKIYVPGSTWSLPGITETSDTKADDTNWEQLSITFTPTEAGIVPIYFSTWYVAGNSNTYIGSVTCTQ